MDGIKARVKIDEICAMDPDAETPEPVKRAEPIKPKAPEPVKPKAPEPAKPVEVAEPEQPAPIRVRGRKPAPKPEAPVEQVEVAAEPEQAKEEEPVHGIQEMQFDSSTLR